VYAARGHEGRGGWTWYTGSASWGYRVALEGMLGFEKQGNRMRLNPCIPAEWPEFTLQYRHGRSQYTIHVRNPHGATGGVLTLTVDGAQSVDGWIDLSDDGRDHMVSVALGPATIADRVSEHGALTS
jgi:cellobiose phosphorylase